MKSKIDKISRQALSLTLNDPRWNGDAKGLVQMISAPLLDKFDNNDLIDYMLEMKETIEEIVMNLEEYRTKLAKVKQYYKDHGFDV
jgi:hypothetical protein